MPTFRFRDQDVELVLDVDDLEVDDAELIEDLFGLDLRDLNSAPLVRRLKAFVLISLRRIDPAATLADAGRVKLGPLLAAFQANEAPEPAVEPDPERPPVEFTGSITVPLVVAEGAPEAGEVLSPTSADSEPSLPA